MCIIYYLLQHLVTDYYQYFSNALELVIFSAYSRSRKYVFSVDFRGWSDVEEGGAI